MNVTIKPATATDLALVSQSRPPATVRAMAVHRGDLLLGVAGIYQTNAGWVMFANPIASMGSYRKTMLRTFRMLLEWTRTPRMPVYAHGARPGDGMDTYFAHLGFKPVDRMNGLWVRNHG